MKTLDGQRRSAVRLLMAVLGAVTLLSRNGAWPIRAGEPDLCLHYADDDTLRLIDPHTGASQQDHQSMAWRVVLSENTQIWPSKLSPDGKHRLHFVGPDATQPQPRLFVDAVDTRRLTLLHTGNLDGGYWWAPDNAYLAFTWHSDQGQGFVTIARPDGTGTLDTAIGDYQNVKSYGWSPDSMYLAFITRLAAEPSESKLVSFLSVATGRWLHQTLPGGAWISGEKWAPRGHELALLADATLTVTSPEGISQAVTSGGGFPALLDWSPNNRYIGIEYQTGGLNSSIDIYRADYVLVKMATVLPPSHSVLADIPWQKLEWSDDAMTLLFLTTGGRTDLISFSVEQQRYETLATDVNIRLVTWFPSPRGTQLVVPWSSTPGTRQLDLMASDGQHRITVWHGTNDIAQILASPDGKYVAFRLIDDVNRLFWLKVNTIDLHEVNPDVTKAGVNMRWSESGRWLTYNVGREPEPEGISSAFTITINVQTAVTHLIPGRLRDDKPSPALISKKQPLNFMRIDADGAYEIDGFNLNGQQAYHFKGVSSVYRSEWNAVLSPDRTNGLVVSGSMVAHEGLSLVVDNVEGSIHVIEPNVSAFYRARWSPDSSMLALAFVAGDGHFVLRIVNASGRQIWRADEFNGVNYLEWTSCPK